LRPSVGGTIKLKFSIACHFRPQNQPGETFLSRDVAESRLANSGEIVAWTCRFVAAEGVGWRSRNPPHSHDRIFIGVSGSRGRYCRLVMRIAFLASGPRERVERDPSTKEAER
jgi:hypothetical protein